jgi:hypothetical protein
MTFELGAALDDVRDEPEDAQAAETTAAATAMREECLTGGLGMGTGDSAVADG